MYEVFSFMKFQKNSGRDKCPKFFISLGSSAQNPDDLHAKKVFRKKKLIKIDPYLPLQSISGFNIFIRKINFRIGC